MSAPDIIPGDGTQVDALYAAACRELRQIARARLRGGARNTMLETTALVHESYLKFTKSGELVFPNRIPFLVYASRVMRSIIIDMVRRKKTDKHGADALHVTLTGDVTHTWVCPLEETTSCVCTRPWSSWKRWTSACHVRWRCVTSAA